MLDTTLKTQFVAGTNLRGDMASADWRFLLPRLDFDQVLCLGMPKLATLLVLAKTCQRLNVVANNFENLPPIVAESKRRGVTNIEPIIADHLANLPYRNGSIDLIFVTKEKRFRKFIRDKETFRELGRVLKTDGVIYFETIGPLDRLLSQKAVAGLPECGLSSPQIICLTPASGELQTAIPLHDEITNDYFHRHLMYTPSLPRRVSRSIDKLLSTYRRAVIAQRSSHAVNGYPPQYLLSLANECGAEVEGYGWGMSAQGRRNSRKVLFFLLDRQNARAEAIVKLTRSPEFNARLENEYRALAFLREKQIVGDETFPQPLFFGFRGHLAILGQKIIQGKPFRQATKATIDCHLAKAAIDWIVDIGAGTADQTAVTPQQAAEVMMRLFQQLVAIYKLSSHEQAFLIEQIDAIGQSAANFPTVFQHGDPGIWNVMATNNGGIAFLDWEAAEQQGVPLWDLFYFLRSYGTWMSRSGGVRDSLKSFVQQFMAPSEFNAFLLQTMERYCQRINLDGRLVEPLFFTCWMHRALKETTRLTPANVEKGHYINLLRLCIDRRQEPALARLFSSKSGEV